MREREGVSSVRKERDIEEREEGRERGRESGRGCE